MVLRRKRPVNPVPLTPVRVPGPDAVEILITSSGDRDDVVHTGTGLRARRGAPHPSR